MANDGLRKVNKSGIVDGAPIEAHHVSHIVDTLNGDIVRDVKLCGSLTLEGSMYNSDTIFSKNFQASSALTVKGDGEQLIFLDKDDSNYIRFRNATGNTNRGYIGFANDNLIISQQSAGNLSLYSNNTESLRIDTSNNISIPNGNLTVEGIISGDGSGLTNLNLTGLDAQQLSNLPDSSVWTEEGSTATYTGTAVATNFQGNGSGLTNINGDNVSKVSNAAHADTAGTANSVDGDNVNGAVASATYATTAGTANSVDGDNVNGAVANATNATYATTAGSAPWDGTLENTQAIITNDNSYSGFLLLKDSDYATTEITLSTYGDGSPTETTTYSADAWIQWQGRTKTIDRTMNHQGDVSYSNYEDKFRMGIDTQGRFRIVRGTSWKGLRIERDSSRIIVDQGLTVSSGGATITGTTTIAGATTITGASTFTGTSTLNGETTINHSSARPLTIHRTTEGDNNDDEVVIAFDSPDDTEGAIIGIDKTANGGGAKLQESSGWKKIYVRSTGGGITTNFTTSGKLTVSSGGAAITGASSFSSTLSTGGKLTVSSGGASITGDVSISGWLTVKGATRGITAGNSGSGNNRYPIVATRFARWTWGDTPNLGITGDGSLPDHPDSGSWTGNADLAVKDYVKAGGFFADSDERLKEYLDVFIPGEALNTLNEITPKLFKWNELSHASGLTDFGFFAQEVEEVFPFGVVTSKTDNFEDQRSINPMAMVALASAAIKDLSKENEILKDRNRELEDRLKLIEEKLGL